MNKRIFLTGRSGFIGRNLLEFLESKYEVLAPTHQELELLDEEAVKKYFEKNKIDVVIHCAVKPGHRNAKDPTNLFYCNTRMFFNIVRNASRFEKMIFLNSGLVYDMRYYMPKMKEEYFGTHVPVDEAGFSKYVCAKYIENVDNIVELRPFGVFGKYEDYAIRFISNAICKTLFGLPITIKQNRKFDYVYIDDLILVVDYFIQNDHQYKAYNVTPDQSIELYALAEKIRLASGKDLLIIVAQQGMGVEYSGDNTRIRQEIPALKFTPTDEAIRNLYDWYAKNRHLINREFLLIDK